MRPLKMLCGRHNCIANSVYHKLYWICPNTFFVSSGENCTGEMINPFIRKNCKYLNFNFYFVFVENLNWRKKEISEKRNKKFQEKYSHWVHRHQTCRPDTPGKGALKKHLPNPPTLADIGLIFGSTLEFELPYNGHRQHL